MEQTLAPRHAMVSSGWQWPSPRLGVSHGGAAGFTLMELLVAMSIMGLVFVPVMSLFAAGGSSLAESGAKLTALNLAVTEMELVRNLALTEEQLAAIGTIWIPREGEPPTQLNGYGWRVRRRLIVPSDPLIIHIEVFRTGDQEPLMTLSSRYEDTTGEGSSTGFLMSGS